MQTLHERARSIIGSIEQGHYLHAIELARELFDWQDAERTYLPSEQQLDTRIDGCTARLTAALG